MNAKLTFAEYERLAQRTDVSVSGEKALMVPLLGLAGEVGSLLSEHKKRIREGDRYTVFTDQVSEEIGDILWYLANIAAKSGLSLADIAAENLAKLEINPPPGAVAVKVTGKRIAARRFDAGFPRSEQLPSRLRIEFREAMEGGSPKLQISQDGNQVGQRLTDNAHYTDGYRFHDVFHLSYAILIGWSPITRRLLDAKRRSRRTIDEIEDGGRASVTEEGISALVFAQAQEHSYFEGAGSVDHDLLKAIRMMCRPFEARVITPRDWEDAILQGFAVWRMMNRNRSGAFVGDAIAGTVDYEPLEPMPSDRGSASVTRAKRKRA